MRLEDMIIVSVDDHVVEPADMFEQHVPASLKDQAPRMLTAENGTNYWKFEDRIVANGGLNAVVGRPKEELGAEPTNLSELRDGCYLIKDRIDDMNAGGILGSMNFATWVQFDGSFFVGTRDKQLGFRMLQAYNDWHIDEWCGYAPDRFIPLAILPLWDIDLLAEELKRVVAKGVHAVTFPDNPAAKGLPSLHNSYWEPLWKLCAENEVIINCHIGTGTPPPHASPESPVNAWLTSFPMSIAASAADWMYLEALRRYPTLKIALSEGGLGWIPYLLERSDQAWRQHHVWTNLDLGPGVMPSDIFRQHFLTCFIDDRHGLENRHTIGLESIMYECDYPHSDTVWPENPEILWESVKDLPRHEIDMVTHLNAMKHYKYDPLPRLGRENCTVGALRAQAVHVDTAPRSRGGQMPLAAGERRQVVAADIMKLFDRNFGLDKSEAA